MTSEAARSFYPQGLYAEQMQKAFDLGAVEALRRAAVELEDFIEPSGVSVQEDLLRMADEWDFARPPHDHEATPS